MTNLSPAAQAVKDAAQELYADRMARKMAWPLDLPVVAAALRAAAKELGPSRKLELGYVFSATAEQWHYEFRLEAERKLLAIASELEGLDD